MYTLLFVLVKHGVLTLVDEIQHYRNDCYFYSYYVEVNVNISLVLMCMLLKIF